MAVYFWVRRIERTQRVSEISKLEDEERKLKFGGTAIVFWALINCGIWDI